MPRSLPLRWKIFLLLALLAVLPLLSVSIVGGLPLALVLGLGGAAAFALFRLLRPLLGMERELRQMIGEDRSPGEHPEGCSAPLPGRLLASRRERRQRLRSVAVDLAGAAELLRAYSGQASLGTARQSQSLEESHRVLEGIGRSAAGIAESTGALLESAETSSSATLELTATIEEVATQMEKLFGIVDEVTASLAEMSVSSQQVAQNTEILSSLMETTASSIVEMDAASKEIEENAGRTSRLSEEAAEDARQGKAAVEETIEGIGSIRESVDRATEVIRGLGDQSRSIGRILTVIDEVADQTSLLALNAAIIAAQAGEHGRGFAVVAEEIRQLAERTAVSTREIAAIVASVQNGTQEAVKAMAAGRERVHQEVARSRSAGGALEKIRESTVKATEQVRGIVRATQEQAKGSRQITAAVHQVASMLNQIATAIRQQTAGAAQLARNAEIMREIASQGKVSTGEQAKGAKLIGVGMDQIRTMIEEIDETTRALTERSREVVEAVAGIRRSAEESAVQAGELEQPLAVVVRQAALLENEVDSLPA